MTGWLRDLHDKAGKATPGPWGVIKGCVAQVSADADEYPIICEEVYEEPDAEFIAACSPERVRALCELAAAAQEKA